MLGSPKTLENDDLTLGMKAAWGRLGSRFVLSGSSHWEPEQSQPGIWAAGSHSPCSCPLYTEAQEPSLPEERQPPGAEGTMAGGRLGEAPRLPPTGLPVPEHPQVSTPAASPPPPHPPWASQLLGPGPWALPGRHGQAAHCPGGETEAQAALCLVGSHSEEAEGSQGAGGGPLPFRAAPGAFPAQPSGS